MPSLSREEGFLISALRLSSRSELRDASLDGLDWSALLEVAAENRAAPWLRTQLAKTEVLGRVPTAAQSALDEAHAEARSQNEGRNAEAGRFLRHFHERKVPVCILKGSMLAQELYRDIGYKVMNDIDLLIHPEDLNQVYAIYDTLDYFYVGERIAGDKARSDAMSFTAPTYISRDRRCVIGTQWGIVSQGLYNLDYPSIWSRMHEIEFEGVPVQAMAWEDLLHHLCVHLGFFKTSARDLMDLVNVADREEFNWSLFASIVEDNGTHPHAYFALRATDTLFGHPDMEALWRRYEPQVETRLRAEADRRLASPLNLLRLNTDYIQDLEKEVAEFFLADTLRSRTSRFLAIYRTLLWPSHELLQKMSHRLEPTHGLAKLRDRLNFPRRFWWMLTTFELSAKQVSTLIAYTYWLLGRSAAQRLMGRPLNKQTRADYAAERGMTESELDALRDSFH